MSIPFLYLMACLLLWGWQTENLLFAIPMAIVLEASGFIGWRWEINRKDFYRVTDFTSILLVAVVVFQFNRYSMHGVYYVLEWFPFVLFLLVFIQRYSQQQDIPYSAFFISMRKLVKDQHESLEERVDFNVVFALITVLAACAGNQRSIWFFIAVCVLIAWLLLRHRSRRYSLVTWVVIILFASVLGFFGQSGMQKLQQSIGQLIMGMMDELFWQNRDPARTTTAIGSLGRFKLSENIRIRVDSKNKLPSPFLLKEASYNYFNLGTWSAQDSPFQALELSRVGYWPLTQGAEQANTHSITISTRLRRNIGVVPMPYHSVSFEDPGTLEVLRSRLGAIQLEGKPGLINYRVNYTTQSSEGEPGPDDLQLSDTYAKPIQQLVKNEGLVAADPQEVVDNIQRFFMDNFRYQLVDRKSYPGKKPLMNFLLKDRRGHCEYFATSTVLMLRAAGIPARYTIGYSIQEYSEIEQRYIARSRHSHAWASAYVNGAWQVVDTTPPSWDLLEQDQGNGLQPLIDFLSWLRFVYTEWQHEEGAGDDSETTSLWLWLLVPLVMLLIWRLSGRKRVSEMSDDERWVNIDRKGLDSEFFQCVQQLQHRGYVLNEGESLFQWLQRIRPLHADTAHIDKMLELLPLHYRYRFDPAGLSAGERHRLKDDSSRLL